MIKQMKKVSQSTQGNAMPAKKIKTTQTQSNTKTRESEKLKMKSEKYGSQ